MSDHAEQILLSKIQKMLDDHTEVDNLRDQRRVQETQRWFSLTAEKTIALEKKVDDINTKLNPILQTIENISWSGKIGWKAIGIAAAVGGVALMFRDLIR